MMKVELYLDSSTTSRGLSTIVESLSFNTTSHSLLFAVFRGLPSAADKHNGIGDNGYNNAFSQSMGLLLFAWEWIYNRKIKLLKEL